MAINNMKKPFQLSASAALLSMKLADSLGSLPKILILKKLFLFGSYARGNPTPESDVDLLIIANSEKPAWKLSAEISLKLSLPLPWTSL